MGWLTGRDLEQRLAEPTTVIRSGLMLRAGLAELSRNKHVASLLDRRIDPERPLDIVLQQVTVKEAFERTAEAQQLGLCWLGPLAYLGPEAATRRLRTIAAMREAEVRQLAKPQQRVWLKERGWRWPDLATPRELVEQLAREAGADVERLDQVPHDLWPAADLPPLSLVDRLSLVAGEFDLTFRIDGDGRQVTLLPVPEAAVIRRTYPGGNEPQAKARQWSERVPDARVEVEGARIAVEGRIEDHERLAEKQGRKLAPAVGGVQVYTLTVENQPIGPLLLQLGPRLGYKIEIDEKAIGEAGLLLDKMVSFSVKSATLDELLEAALKPAGLAFRRKDKVVQVLPAKR